MMTMSEREQAYGAVCAHGQLARSCNICELEQERDEWKAKAEANERDAARYRWLRDVGDARWRPFGIREGYSAAQADAAIDAARSAEKEKE